jgi:hypothetical protein
LYNDLKAVRVLYRSLGYKKGLIYISRTKMKISGGDGRRMKGDGDGEGFCIIKM